MQELRQAVEPVARRVKQLTEAPRTPLLSGSVPTGDIQGVRQGGRRAFCLPFLADLGWSCLGAPLLSLWSIRCHPYPLHKHGYT